MPGDDLFYRVYDDVFADKDYAGEVRLALALGGIGAPERCHVLEIGAGTGNHSIACARLGCAVTALEIDARMIEVMGAKLAALESPLRSRIRLFAGPLEALEPGSFDLAIALFNVVNHLADLEALASLFASVQRNLRRGASFVFDAWNGVAALRDPPRDKTSRVETPSHVLDISLESRTDPMRSETRLLYTIESREKQGPGRETGRYTLRHSFWPPRVLTDLLEQSGFELRGVFALGEPMRLATAEDWKLLFHCRRP